MRQPPHRNSGRPLRQIFKQFLTNRVLKDPKQRRFFKSNDIYELFTLSDPDGSQGTETSAIFSGNLQTEPITLLNGKLNALRTKPVRPSFILVLVIARLDLLGSAKADVLLLIASSPSFCKILPGTGSDVQVPKKRSRRRTPPHSSPRCQNGTVDPKDLAPDVSRSSVASLSPSDGVSTVRGAGGSTVTDGCGASPEGEGSVGVAGRPQDLPQKQREKRKHCDSKGGVARHRDARFEGQRIPHLVKKRRFKKAGTDEDEEAGRSKGDQRKSDDYVLAKLFKKSGKSKK